MKKLLLTIMIASTITMSACAPDQENPPQDSNVEITQEETQDKEHVENQKPINNVLENTGVYIGQIDSNTVEIKVDSSPMVFVITEVLDEIHKLEEDEEVLIQYVENEHGQFILKGIEQVN